MSMHELAGTIELQYCAAIDSRAKIGFLKKNIGFAAKSLPENLFLPQAQDISSKSYLSDIPFISRRLKPLLHVPHDACAY